MITKTKSYVVLAHTVVFGQTDSTDWRITTGNNALPWAEVQKTKFLEKGFKSVIIRELVVT